MPLPAEALIRIATAGPLVVAAWFAIPTVAATERLTKALASAAAAHGAVALLDLIVKARPAPTEDAYRALSTLIRDVDCEFGVAHVVQLRGIAGAAARTMLGALCQVARPGAPIRVFDATAPAIAWLRERGCAADADAIARAIDEVTATEGATTRGI